MVFPGVGFPNPPVESPPKELAEDAKVKAKELSKHSSRCRMATGWGLLQRSVEIWLWLNYPLVMTHSLLLKMVIFHSYVNVYQRVDYGLC